MRSKAIFKLVIGLVFITLISACGGPRKCNGQRGIKTEMGTM